MDSERFRDPIIDFRNEPLAHLPGLVVRPAHLEETEAGADQIKDARGCHADDQRFESTPPEFPPYDTSLPDSNSEQKQW